MCGRYALKASPAEIVASFDLAECADFSPRYNIPPGTDIPVIRLSPEGRRVLHLLRWGLIPHWARDAAIGAKLNNARGESVAERPSFRDAFRRRRCLIPASGFYEWQAPPAGGKTKQPWYISLADDEAMALGGLWESWRSSDGGIVRSCCVVTTAANELMAPIHDRMPVIVAPEHWQEWLAAPTEAALPLLAPHPAAGMRAWSVSRRVSKAGDDDAALIEPIEATE
jgi:putative SOS response-associated peptidase YedK